MSMTAWKSGRGRIMKKAALVGWDEEVVDIVVSGIVGGGGGDVLCGVDVIPLVEDVAGKAVDADEGGVEVEEGECYAEASP